MPSDYKVEMFKSAKKATDAFEAQFKKMTGVEWSSLKVATHFAMYVMAIDVVLKDYEFQKQPGGYMMVELSRAAEKQKKGTH